MRDHPPDWEQISIDDVERRRALESIELAHDQLAAAVHRWDSAVDQLRQVGVSVTALQKLLGVSRGTAHRWLRGALPSRTTLDG